MRKTLAMLAATVLATLLVASSSFEPAAAQRGIQGNAPGVSGGSAARAPSGGGVRSYSGGGVRSYSRGPSASTRQFSRTYRSPSVRSSGVYAYRGHSRRHARHFRRGVIVGAPLAYGYYAYSDSCYWLRRRALETGSSYWWNRYYDCLEGYDYY
jgi:hypothetical protein